MSHNISATEDLKDIRYSGKDFRKSLFADDASLLLDASAKSFETLISILDNFAYTSGLKLNAKKCRVLRIGTPVKNEDIY